MKIAVASDDSIMVTGHVGKCRGFMIFDVEKGKIINKEFRENRFTDHFASKDSSEGHAHRRGHGHGNNEGHKRLADGIKDCTYLISHGMGWRLVEDLKVFNIQPIVTNETNAEQAAIKLEQGSLKMDDNLICR